MRREVRLALRSLPRRPLAALAGWSVLEALPASLSGLAVARAVDSGFLAGKPAVGLAWLGMLVVAAGLGALGSRQAYRLLGDLVEPFRDDLVDRVVGGALRRGVLGGTEDGALARLTHQVEIVRDTYAGMIVVVRGFVVTVAGVIAGALSVAPVIVALIVPPFLLGFGLFLTTLRMASGKYRASVLADERLAVATADAFSGTRDVVACGAEDHVSALVSGPIADQAAAERAIARVAATRSLCFALGGWLPLVTVLCAGPWLVSRGLTAGAVMGGLTYVLVGLQPVLRNLIAGVGTSGLRLVVTLGRILDAADPLPEPPREARYPVADHDLEVRAMTFAYGAQAEPVLADLDLTVPAGSHVAILGPSGIGKSTLAGLLCGLLRPNAGIVHLGGFPVADLPRERLAGLRTLIPQEAYVFAATLGENLRYLNPAATATEVAAAVRAVGAEDLVSRLGGTAALIDPAELSAGERQLVALVRAYLCPAPVVILDEATCHLDPAAERVAEEAFAARGGTLVVIAHRISSALRAPRILVLDGSETYDGDHDTLVATSPLYRQLLGHWQRGEGTRPAGPPRQATAADHATPTGTAGKAQPAAPRLQEV